MKGIRILLAAALALPPLAAQAAPFSLSRNADLLVPGQGSALLHPPRHAPLQKKITVPLMVRGREVATVRMAPDMRVEADDLSDWIAANMNEAARRDFGALAAKGSVLPGETEGAGFSLSYDEALAALRLDPDPARLERQDIALQAAAPPPGQEVLGPAPLSAFLNLRGAETYIHHGGANGRQPARLDLDGAVNMKGWVLEGRGDWLEGDDRAWMRDDTRLVRDWPEKMVRGAAGDLSYPVTGFQSFSPGLGISIARNFDLQPYRVTQPAGAASFVIRSPSRADIYVNGHRTRTLRLDPGAYSARDFPVTDGANSVRLVITDAGGRVEEINLSVLGDQDLLREGLHEYSYNLGVESETADRKIRYHLDAPLVSAFHRYGFSDRLTAGISLQGDKNARQAGIEAAAAIGKGILGAEASASHLDGHGPGGAARLSFRRRLPAEGRDFSASIAHRSPRFASLGQTAPLDTAAWEASARYSRTILSDISAGVGGRYRFMRGDAKDDWSYGATFSKTVSRSITLNVTGERRSADGAGVFANIVWTPPQSRHSYSAAADTLTRTESVEWRYHQDRALQSWQASVGAAREGGGRRTGTGSLSYAGYRGGFSLRHDLASGIGGAPADSRSELLAETAIAYAGGRFALTRPVTGSFILLERHPGLGEREIGINPETASAADAGGHQARIDNLGPAVLPDAVPYMYRPVRIDTRGLPPGYDIGQDLYTAFPTYKSGTFLTVGSADNIYADGYLHFAGGAPAALQGGILQDTGDEKRPPHEFFTNADGRFRVTHLRPGTYALSLHARPGKTISLVIPKDTPAGRFDAGTLTFTEIMR